MSYSVRPEVLFKTISLSRMQILLVQMRRAICQHYLSFCYLIFSMQYDYSLQAWWTLLICNVLKILCQCWNRVFGSNVQTWFHLCVMHRKLLKQAVFQQSNSLIVWIGY